MFSNALPLHSDNGIDDGRTKLSTARSEVSTALITDLLSSGISVKVRVTGRSMSPVILSGDRVVVKQASAGDLYPGDIVLFLDAAGGMVLHRMIFRKNKKSSRQFVCKGDTLWRADESVTADRVIGKVEQIIKPSGKVIRLAKPGWQFVTFWFTLIQIIKAHVYSHVLKRSM